MPQNRAITDRNHGFRPKLGLLPESGSFPTAKNNNFHQKIVYTNLNLDISKSQRVPGFYGVAGEHFNRVERERGEVHAEKLGGFRQNVVLDRYDVAAAFFCL